MTVINNPARNQYIANSAQTIFNYSFQIQANTNINVYQRAAGSTPNDTLDILQLGVDYTVTGVGVNTGGTVILNVGAAMGDIITLEGNAPPTRSTSFTPGGVIQAQNLNLEFDNDVLIYQTIMAILGYLTPKYPQSAVVLDFERVLPNLGKNQVWQMNDDLDAIIASTMVSGEVFASHASGQGASLIGLHPVGTVQDLANAPFILRTANPAAPNAQSLGALASGILKNTTASGVLSISNSLTSLDGLTIAADTMAYGTGSNTWGLTNLTAFARTLLDDATATLARQTLGLIIGTDVQAYNDNLQSISSLGSAANKMIYTTGVHQWAEADLSPYSRTLLDNVDLAAWQLQLGIPGGGGAYFAISNNLSEGDPAIIRTNIGLVIGTDVQAYSATLNSIAPLGTMADVMLYSTGVNTWAEAPITALGRSILAAATQADANTAIGSLPLAGGTMTGNLILNGPATIGSQATTLDQVLSLLQNDEQACVVMTTADMPTWTYNNGTAGVGATLTAPINGSTTFDGVVLTNGQRILVNLQTTNPAWQGAYTIVQGTGGTPTVLTRAADYNTPTEINPGDVFTVVQGTTWGGSQWMMNQVITPIVIGTTPITFTQLVGQGALLKANNLSDLTNVATARTNLGLVIGTNVQAYDATLQSISGLGTAANKMIYTTGIDTWAEADISVFGRGVVAITGANNSLLVTNGSAIPSLSTDIPTGITIGSQYIYRVGGTDVSVADGGTGVSSTTAYGLLAGGTTSAGALQNIGTGATGTIIRGAGASSLPTWSTTTYPATNAINTLLYASAANVMSALTTANSSVLVTDVSGVPSWSATLPNINIGTPSGGTLTNCTGYTVANLADVAWTSFAGTIGYTGFSGTPTTNYARSKTVGKTLFFEISMSGTSNAATFTITNMPAAAARTTGAVSAIVQGLNNGSSSFVAQYGTGSNTTLTMYISNNGGGWTSSGTKGVTMQGFYEIA